MQNVLYIEISIVGIFLLLIIIFNQRQNTGFSTLQRQFNLLVYAEISILVIDTACWLLDGTTFPHARAVNIIVETLYYCFNILMPFLWVVYVELFLNKRQKETYRRLHLLAIPMVALLLFLVINLFTKSVFIIDENNVYHRNTGYLLYAGLAFFYMGYASVRGLIAIRRANWKEEKRRYYPMVYFIIPAAIGGIIQTFIYGLTLIWVFVAVSIMMLYIDSLNQQISADPLTGINNRRELNMYLLHETKDSDNKGILALIMMDVDGFKLVNDTYGHFYGDGILVAVADILKQSCKNTPAFLARYGGDEFCIVYPARNKHEVEDLIETIQSNVIAWNRLQTEPVTIGLSIGYSVWNPDTDEYVEELYKRADQEMYLAKSKKKRPKLVS